LLKNLRTSSRLGLKDKEDGCMSDGSESSCVSDYRPRASVAFRKCVPES